LAGALVETLHNASLIIDDIEDNSLKRRGEDCCHIKFGLPLAVNAGTTAYFLALNCILKHPQVEKRAALLEGVVREMTNLHLGQNQDITWNRDVMGTDYQYTEDGYITLCRHKTGGLMRVILAWCQTLSAAVVPPEDLASYADLFNGIGVLFQIIDDILNLEDSTVASNKSSPGEDIREGNKTIIVIHALNNGSPDDKSRLKEILLSKTSDQKVIAEAIQICHRTSSMQYAKDFAKRMVKDLKELNHGLLKHKGARSLVEQLIDLIYTRKN
jgi:geranylgeranyl pyrophosphate synthase